MCLLSGAGDVVERESLSSRRIVRHKPPLSAVFLSVGHSVLGGRDRMPDSAIASMQRSPVPRKIEIK